MTTGLRIGTVQDEGNARAVLVLDGGVCFLDEAVPGAPADVRGLIAGWDHWGAEVMAVAHSPAPGSTLRPVTHVHWLAPLTPRKLLCVGSNYHDHVAEMDGPAGVTSRPAPFPYSFLKPVTALVGSGQSVARPSYGRKLDWEIELAVVIGDPAAATGPDPLAAVFGYTILNDLSLRDFIPFPHALGLDVVVSKGFDGAAPTGPWITLAADVPDPQALGLQLSINGEVMQNSSTAQMIFDVAALISHYVRVLSLEPGDLIATGTPAGVGAARPSGGRFLAPGDEIEARIDGLGTLTTSIGPPVADEPLPTTIEVNA
jgi:2,4-didehydro-3-deoxy-L-rhamnonate hydrolase